MTVTHQLPVECSSSQYIWLTDIATVVLRLGSYTEALHHLTQVHEVFKLNSLVGTLWAHYQSSYINTATNILASTGAQYNGTISSIGYN